MVGTLRSTVALMDGISFPKCLQESSWTPICTTASKQCCTDAMCWNAVHGDTTHGDAVYGDVMCEEDA